MSVERVSIRSGKLTAAAIFWNGNKKHKDNNSKVLCKILDQ